MEIAGGNDEPYIPGNPGLFIMWVKLGSEADRLLSPGCQLIKVSCSSSFFFSRFENEGKNCKLKSLLNERCLFCFMILVL